MLVGSASESGEGDSSGLLSLCWSALSLLLDRVVCAAVVVTAAVVVAVAVVGMAVVLDKVVVVAVEVGTNGVNASGLTAIAPTLKLSSRLPKMVSVELTSSSRKDEE